jgi:glucose dehydrogenase
MFLAQSRNVVHALDARSGDLIWEYRRQLPDVKASYHRRQFSYSAIASRCMRIECC